MRPKGPVKAMTVGDAIGLAADDMAREGVADAQNDARLMMAEALGISRAKLVLWMQEPLPAAAEADFLAMFQQRAARVPLSQVLGYRDFYASRFLVTVDVLDPRPETETLVDLALAEPFSEVLDLGTGSGAILLSVLKERKTATGTGVDISAKALAVAARNARALGLEDRLFLTRSDWFEAVAGRYDLIMSNPPYVSEADYAGLSPEVRHEPKIALTPGGDGLAAYRVIAREAPGHLTPGGRLLVEIGFDQGTAVAQLFVEAGLDDVAVHPDLSGKDRVVSARARQY